MQIVKENGNTIELEAEMIVENQYILSFTANLNEYWFHYSL